MTVGREHQGARATGPVPARQRASAGVAGAPLPDAGRLAAIHEMLLDWYAHFGRDLPWRRTHDPYAILVSEIMLQQTQVERVRPKFHEFLEAFATFADLAAAPVAKVIRRWSPLGYNRRAVRLHEIARTVVERLGGRLPNSEDGLRELEGLGSYTANAVACFAFGRPVAVVDTNVRRVLGRVFVDLIGFNPPAGRPLDAFAQAVLPVDRAYDWNQAVMDLGATICTARAPACLICPLALVCVGRSMLADAPRRLPRAAERGVSYATRQPFEQSARYYRGRIVDLLRALPPDNSRSVDDIGRALRDDYGPEHRPWVTDLVRGLQRDSLAAIEAGDDGPRVRLP